jgi:hypothetical protein
MGAAILGHADVRRLHIAMHETALVGEGETGEHVDRDVELLGDREGGALREQVLEIAALEILHRDEQMPFDLAEVEDGDDVRML